MYMQESYKIIILFGPLYLLWLNVECPRVEEKKTLAQYHQQFLWISQTYA